MLESDSLEREALATATATTTQQQHSSSASSRLRMKLLWIPHLPWPALDGQRERRLLDNWPDCGDELHILTWQPAQGFGRHLSSLGWSNFRQERTTVHSRPRIPNVMGRVVKNYARGLWANEQLFRFYTKQLVHKLGVDVLVYGIGHKVVGLPPFDLPIARVFDYLDLITYPDVEAAYIANSDLVLCTSRVLVDRLQTSGKQGVYVPNGVSMGRIALGQRDRTRAALGLQDKQVVSLIGLTSSPSLFFVDALALAAQQVPNIVFMVVGGGELLRPIVARCQRLGLPFVTTGQVPSNEVANYFAATDLGLYAGDANAYYDAACPIKVLEYTAARKPVVATDLEELRRMAFPNVRLSPPDPARFAAAIITSLREPTEFADVSAFEWGTLAQNVRQALVTLIQERRR
jgi:glycosyltransferase involved in cell wall biosynthesis